MSINEIGRCETVSGSAAVKMFWTTGVVLATLIFGQISTELVEPGVFDDNVMTGVSSANERIMGGWQAHPGQFPYMSQVRFFVSAAQWRNCGGSIIHNNWVLSSAFCATVANNTHARVFAGVTDVSTTPQYVSDTSVWKIHPLFNVNSPSTVQPYDICILRLQQSLIYTTLVQPIRIESSANAFREYTNELFFTLGWGRVSQNNVLPNVLNWVYLRGISNQDCSPFYPSSDITDYHICAAGFHFLSQSTCTNDDGGPLTRIDQLGQPVLVGIVGFWHGTPCGNGRPSGFNRISPFHSWLNNVTGIDFDEAAEPPTTEAAGLSTTEAPGLSTTEAPGLSTTEEPGLSTTEAPGVSTTEALGLSTTEAPGLCSTEVTSPPTTETPEPPTTEATEPPTTAETEPPTTEATEPPTTEATEPPTTAETEPPTTEATEPPPTEATEPPTTEVTRPPVTEPTEPDSEESDEDSNESDSSESEEDPELYELFNKLLVKIKVKVKVENSKIKKNVTIST